MKRLVTIKSLCSGLALALLLTLAATPACSKKPTVDTVKLQYVEASDPNTKSAIEEAVEAIDKGDNATGLEKLKKAVADPKLTADQKATVNDVIQQLEKK